MNFFFKIQIGTSKEGNFKKSELKLINDSFFFKFIALLDVFDSETRKSCITTLASFSEKPEYLCYLSEIQLFPRIFELFENQENEICIRRSALMLISRFTKNINYCIKYFTEQRILTITKQLINPSMDDLSIISVQILADLSCIEEFSDFIMLNYFSTIETISMFSRGTDTQASWELDVCFHYLSSNADKDQFKKNFGNKYSRDDKFNYETIRLLCNLISNCKFFFNILLPIITKIKYILVF